MTDLLSRPVLRVSLPEPGPDRPLVATAVLATAVVAVSGVVLCVAASVVGWFAGDAGTFGAAVRIGGVAWLVGNGAGLQVAGYDVSLAPLGSVLLAGYALYRGGRWAGRTALVPGPATIRRAVGAAGAVYAVAALVAWVATRGLGAHPVLWRALAVTAVVGAGCVGLGILAGSGRSVVATCRLPEEVAASMYGGLAGLAIMVGAGAVALAASLLAHFSTAVTLAEGMHSGLVGGLILALVGMALVPNAVLCGSAFIAGPGFAVGTGTMVAPGHVRLGPMPDFPLLAAVPAQATAWWQAALVGVPVVAGLVAGLVALRRCPTHGLDRESLRGALAGLAAGAALGLLCAMAAGSIGPGRMSQVGPDTLATLAVCVVACLVGGAAAGPVRVLVAHGWARWSPGPPVPVPRAAEDEPTVRLGRPGR
ncbi:MAG TPA: DUF6350 family protein [Nocardioidaceae bacterium]|nr:DUF6350 family protein [Nocardioidaceae bacterium]